jgi:adenosylmethionine-8-amino-7-oxononanoate aminotransferase
MTDRGRKGIVSSAGGGVQHFWLPADAPCPPRLARAEGVYVWDTQGQRYLDATSGPVAVNLGHGNRRVLDALAWQAGRACFAYPSYFESEDNVLLGDLLARQAGAGLDRTFLVSGGSEAVEKCLEFARLHALAAGQPSRHRVISRLPAYHGSTLACQALSEDPANSPLAPMLPRWPRVPAPFPYRPAPGLGPDEDALRCAEALREQILAAGPDSVLAFILEPVMGLSGGASHGTPAYYRRVREICDEFRVLLIYDEVMSGAGRTGRFLAAQHWPDARPDLVVLGKGLGSGYVPLAGFMASDAMTRAVVDAGGFHLGHTHKASPLSCAVGLAVMREIVERNLAEHATETGENLRARLRELQREIPEIGDVRGLGLLNAIEIVADQDTRAMFPRDRDVPKEISRIALEQGLLLYARRTSGGRYGDWIMITPPLTILPAELDELIELLARTLRIFRERAGAASRRR